MIKLQRMNLREIEKCMVGCHFKRQWVKDYETSLSEMLWLHFQDDPKWGLERELLFVWWATSFVWEKRRHGFFGTIIKRENVTLTQRTCHVCFKRSLNFILFLHITGMKSEFSVLIGHFLTWYRVTRSNVVMYVW